MKNSNTDYPLREKLRPVEETLNRLFRAAKADSGAEKRLLYSAYLQAATDLGYIVVQADDERIFCSTRCPSTPAAGTRSCTRRSRQSERSVFHAQEIFRADVQRFADEFEIGDTRLVFPVYPAAHGGLAHADHSGKRQLRQFFFFQQIFETLTKFFHR